MKISMEKLDVYKRASTLLMWSALLALSNGLFPSKVIASDLTAYKIIHSEGDKPATVRLEEGGTLSFYNLMERSGFGGAGFLEKEYVVYAVPRPVPDDRDSYLVASVNDYAAGQMADHFEASASGGDCLDTDKEFFSNGRQVIAISFERQNVDHHGPRAGDGPGIAFMKLYVGRRNEDHREIPFWSYHFEMKEKRLLKGISYCQYKDVEAAVNEVLKKYENYAY